MFVYPLKSGGVYVKTPVELLYDNAPEPEAAFGVPTLKSVKDTPPEPDATTHCCEEPSLYLIFNSPSSESHQRSLSEGDAGAESELVMFVYPAVLWSPHECAKSQLDEFASWESFASLFQIELWAKYIAPSAWLWAIAPW